MKRMGRYLLILVLVMILWDSAVIKPLKIFTVFLHELGHAAMAFIFGYGIQGFAVNPNESGYTLIQTKDWFSSFMIANGGYLGSVLFALLILYLKGTGFKKYILGSLSILFLAISIQFSGFSFTLIYAITFSVAVLVVYMLRNDRVEDWLIDIMGISSIAYAIYDTFVDTILLQLNIQFRLLQGWKVAQPMTDAVQLSKMTGIPAMVWGVVWLALALVAVYFVLIKTSSRSKKYR